MTRRAMPTLPFPRPAMIARSTSLRHGARRAKLSVAGRPQGNPERGRVSCRRGRLSGQRSRLGRGVAKPNPSSLSKMRGMICAQRSGTSSSSRSAMKTGVSWCWPILANGANYRRCFARAPTAICSFQELDADRVVLPPYQRAEKHASALRNFKLELGGKYEVLTDLKPGATQ
jgi:hypothetical protein